MNYSPAVTTSRHSTALIIVITAAAWALLFYLLHRPLPADYISPDKHLILLSMLLYLSAALSFAALLASVRTGVLEAFYLLKEDDEDNGE